MNRLEFFKTRHGRLLVTSAGLIVSYLLVLALFSVGILDSFHESIIVTIGINIVLAVSLNLITGFTGQFSLGHAGFMAIGAYTTALVVMRIPNIFGFFAGLLLGGLIAALIGFLVGLPTLRLRGDYLAIATLGLAEIIRIFLLNADSITNGAAGLFNLPRFVNWTWLFVFVVGSYLLIKNFLRSAPGRDLIAVREDEIAASSIGVNATKAKTLAFVIGAFFGAIAGGLYTSYFYGIQPRLFDFMKSVDILIIVVLGGLGSLSGSVIAAILLGLVNVLLQDYADIQRIIYGLILVILMVWRPQGLLGDRELSVRMFRNLGESIAGLPSKIRQIPQWIRQKLRRKSRQDTLR